MTPGTALLLPAAGRLPRNGDTHFPFRQNSHFYYITGLHEPDAWSLCVMRDTLCWSLWLPPADQARDRWEGPRLTQAQARTMADAVYTTDALASTLPDALQDVHTLCFPWWDNPTSDRTLMRVLSGLQQAIRRGSRPPMAWHHADVILGSMRRCKDPWEQQCIRQSVDCAVQAHRALWQVVRPGVWEHELEAAWKHRMIQQGARFEAYPSIVAGAERACVLHYTDNNQQLQDGDLVLVDAGCEWAGYASDITRTLPVNGTFSPHQADLYQVVLDAQCAGLQAAQPGRRWSDIQQAMLPVLVEGLVRLGIVQGRVEDALARKAYRPYYMHGSGHWLGLDVHDAGAYHDPHTQDSCVLEPGMVLTVEPGLYIAPDADVDPVWRGMGIRIEDDVLITDQGQAILSHALPKSIEAIEACLQAAPP